MRVRAGAKTDVGRVRKANEDSHLNAAPLFAVADGMGGHEAGEVASGIAVAVLAEGNPPPPDAPPDAWLTERVAAANRAVFDRGSRSASPLRMGTTLTVAYAAPDAVYVGHVGDSRAYLLREGRLLQITDDHSLVAELVRDGRLSAAEAAVHPQRSVITRALGIEPTVAVEMRRIVPNEGDRILLCSDGLTGPTTDDAIRDILAGEGNPQVAADRLVGAANDGGGEDNITAVVIDVMEAPAAAVPGPTAAAPGAAPAPPAPAPGTARRPDAPEPVAPPHGGVIVKERPAASTEPPGPGPGKARRWLKLLLGLATLVVVLGGLWTGARWVQESSWYVGVEDGNVAVFQGLPEGLAGIKMSKLVNRESIVVDQLPERKRKELAKGIRAADRRDADRIVENLRRLTEPAPTPTPTPAAPVAPTPGP